jgi:hypothetical protein
LVRFGDLISSEADRADSPMVVGSAVVAFTGGDVAMKVVSVASQYFLPGIADSERYHVRKPDTDGRAFM